MPLQQLCSLVPVTTRLGCAFDASARPGPFLPFLILGGRNLFHRSSKSVTAYLLAVTSSTLPLTHEIYQGSILSPLLFTPHQRLIYSKNLQIDIFCR